MDWDCDIFLKMAQRGKKRLIFSIMVQRKKRGEDSISDGEMDTLVDGEAEALGEPEGAANQREQRGSNFEKFWSFVVPIIERC